MKLRIRSGSIRLRLDDAECRALAAGGRIESILQVGPDPTGWFFYSIETSKSSENPEAFYGGGRLRLVIPAAAAVALRDGTTDAIAGVRSGEGIPDLEILVERDYIP